MFKKVCLGVAAGVAYVGTMVGQAHAAFTLPEMPVSDLELAGTAVAALIGIYVVIKFSLRMLRGA